MAGASPYGRGLMKYLKQGWNEIPAVMGSSVMALAGIVLGTYGIIQYEKKGNYAPTYKKRYTVYRPDDPRINRPTHDWI